MTAGAVLRLAGREARASWRRFLVLIAAVAVGVAALVAINGFTANLRESVGVRSRELLGADLRIETRAEFSPAVQRIADSLARQSAAVARVIYFGAMGWIPRTDGTRPVSVTAVEGGYPFYGAIRTEPEGRWTALDTGRVALVDPALLAALDARPGDTLALGEGRFVIAGALLNFPGDIGLGSAFSPRVAIPARYVGETGLLQFGSRAEYAAFFRMPGADTEALAERLRPILRSERATIRSADEDQPRLGRALERLTSFLGLVALIALLLGGLGVASAVHVFLRQKLETIAVLRCLGATARQVFAVYLIQAAGMGLAGSVAGVLLGLTVQLALPQVLGDFLPVDVPVRPSAAAVLAGLGTGLWVAIAFSLLPLLTVRAISPLAAIRRIYDERPPQAGAARWIVLALLAASVVVLARLQVADWRMALAFAAAVGAALLLLALGAWALVRLLRRWFPSRWPYVWRQGLANLYRPANQTLTIVLALGFGAFLLATIYLVQHNLLRTLSLGGDTARPNLVLIDIQPDQRAGVDSVLDAAGHPNVATVPIVPMRIRALAGRSAEAILADTAAAEPPERWAVRREYRSTYRDSLTGSERILEGEWGWETPAARGPDAVYDISVEAGVAAELGVSLGDEIVWDIQGVPLRTRIRSLREVDWARFEPNFFVVFDPAALRDAPQTFVALTRVPDATARGRLQRALVERFPNITSLDLAFVQATVERVIGRVVLAVRFMALFSLATGALVLVGAVATTRFQRLREGVLLRTLGATRAQVVRIVATEYLALGVLASLVAVGLASLAGWGLSRWVFEIPFGVPVPQLAGVAGAVIVLTAVVGAANSRDAVTHTPLEVLRNE